MESKVMMDQYVEEDIDKNCIKNYTKSMAVKDRHSSSTQDRDLNDGEIKGRNEEMCEMDQFPVAQNQYRNCFIGQSGPCNFPQSVASVQSRQNQSQLDIMQQINEYLSNNYHFPLMRQIDKQQVNTNIYNLFQLLVKQPEDFINFDINGKNIDNRELLIFCEKQLNNNAKTANLPRVYFNRLNQYIDSKLQQIQDQNNDSKYTREKLKAYKKKLSRLQEKKKNISLNKFSRVISSEKQLKHLLHKALSSQYLQNHAVNSRLTNLRALKVYKLRIFSGTLNNRNQNQ